MDRYIEVILPLKLEWNPCYSVHEEVQTGCRVRVLFAHKEYIGVVVAVDAVPDVNPSRVMPVISIERDLPCITEAELRMWNFISDYYLCSIGEVYRAAYPVQKIKSEESALSIAARSARAHEKTLSVLQRRVSILKDRLERKEAELIKKHSDEVRSRLAVQRDGIAEELKVANLALEECMSRNDRQQNCAPAQTSCPGAGKAGKPILLSSANRRDAYIRLASESLANKRNVLVLVPENDFAPAIEESFRNEFGTVVLVYNSRLTAAKRRDIADHIRSGSGPYVLVGGRSSLYLPFSGLGLVIVDEEQDPLHKQTDPAPRINSRDCAAMLASIHGAQFVLGSATPSLETLHNCITGKYARGDEASGELFRPEVIDVSAERRKNGMAGPYSLKLKEMVRVTEGRVIFVRGWENADELSAWTGDVFGDRPIELMTAAAARKIKGKAQLIAVIQADALFSKDDFRSDERVLQLLRQIGEHAGTMVVQTAKSEHPVFKALSAGSDASVLLPERQQFGLPPYTKLVDIRIDDANDSRRSLMASRLCSALGIAGLRVVLDRNSGLSMKKAGLRKGIACFEKEKKYFSHIKIDVDPQ